MKTGKMKALLAAVCIAASVATVTTVVMAASDVQTTTEGRSKADIIQKWQQYKPMAVGFDYMNGMNIYEEQPSLQAPYKAGKLKKEYILDGIKAVNFIRYLAGLPDDVKPDWSLELQEQTGALVNAVNQKLTHTPSKPADMDEAQYKLGYAGTSSSNLYAGDPTLYSNVLGYMSDSDTSNIDRVGHRRWIINPTMKQTMFGFVYSKTENDYMYPYAALHAFNRERPKDEVSYSYVSWPAAGYFPSEVFAPQDAWSVSLNPDKYDKTRVEEIHVTLTRVSDNKSWSFDKTNTDKKGRYFNVETGGYGIPFCIIFRPDALEAINSNDQFRVDVSGIYDKGGRTTSIQFETNFFQLIQPVQFRAQSLLLKKGEQIQLQTVQPSSVLSSNIDGKLYSDHPEVASINITGQVTALKAGTTEIRYKNYFQEEQRVSIEVVNSNSSEKVSEWAMEAYTKAKGNGIIGNYLDRNYQKPINRLDFAQAAVDLCENILGKPLEGMDSPFKDIDDISVGKAVKNGLIQGTSTAAFSPWETLTRQEAASLLIRLNDRLNQLLHKDGFPTASTNSIAKFADDSQITGWARDNVYKAVQLGLLGGVGQGNFNPRGHLTHEQTYIILENVFERFITKA
ncbi:hypothetical protein Back11_52940 [Paenibacillus baekrokdamisoli]|uniref:Uncharacterized protein n=1 Tax=Paenibacillus baekrokdamisoli TaxID=1712516 RepID=A0A3G9JLN9_9BACL|nr:S-layer homology domain-containing protein [Paenibacillus baekrokdamisoli]MBB3073324.1 hypothetical protein [Paenibacillus baekrokdamisoli]BBH23949.1 hypothetical protein Back11_52940 [Paenibacillus baekrokdamisoli]